MIKRTRLMEYIRVLSDAEQILVLCQYLAQNKMRSSDN